MTFEDYLIKHRYLVLLITVAIFAASIYQLKFAEFNDDMRVFFGDNNPQLLAYEKFEQIYGKNNNVVVGFINRDGDMFTREMLQAVKEFTDQAWQIPLSLRTDSMANFQRTILNEEGDLLVRPLYEDPTTLTDEQLAEVRRIATTDATLAGRLVAEDGSMAAVNINLIVSRGGPNAAENKIKVQTSVNQLVDQLKAKYPSLIVYKTGGVYADDAFNEATLYDLKYLFPIMVVLMIGAMLLFLRSISGTICTILVVLMAAATALGGAIALGIKLSPTTAMAPIVVITVGIADSVHILVTFFHAMNDGKSKQEAINEALQVNHVPILITSVTTMIGFLSMNFNDSPPFRDMGNVVAIGVIAAYIYSVFSLPALLSILPFNTKRQRVYRFKLIDLLSEFVVARYRLVFVAMVAVIVGLGAAVPKIEFNDLFLEYFDDSIEFRRNNDFFVEKMSGLMAIHYNVKAVSGEGGINEPDYLRQLGELANWYQQQPGVLHVTSYTDIIFRLNRTWNDDDPDYYVAPSSRELAAQYLLLFELSLPAGLDLSNFINVEKSASRMSVALDNLKTDEIIQLDERAQAWAKNHAPALILPPAVGESVMFAHIAKRNIESMLTGVYIALFLISAVILMALRNIKLGILSFIPNVTPIIMAFGVWALLVGELGMSGGSVLVVALGIIVDDTVHFLAKYQRARRNLSLEVGEAIKYSFNTVGVALLVTSGILVGGFSILYESAFKPSKDLGLLISLSVGLALIATFLLLPSLLMFLDKKPYKR